MRDADSELVTQCRSGDRRAFETLVQRYERPIFNAAYRMVDSLDDARDVTQTVFLKAFEKLDSFDPHYRFYSWIYRIALNESINLLNGRKYVTADSDEQASDWKSPEENLRTSQVCDRVQDALKTISSEYRSVIILKHFLGCSYSDISLILQVEEKTVKSRLFTARQRLREALSDSELI